MIYLIIRLTIDLISKKEFVFSFIAILSLFFFAIDNLDFCNSISKVKSKVDLFAFSLLSEISFSLFPSFSSFS